MQEKTLILGAIPPFTGPWVPISREEEWWSYAETIPNTIQVNGECGLEVLDEHDSITSLSLGDKFRGVKVRCWVKEIEGVENITIHIKARP